MRHGLVQVSDGTESPLRARLRLTEDHLIVQREELVYTHTNNDIDSATLAKVGEKLYNHNEVIVCIKTIFLLSLTYKISQKKAKVQEKHETYFPIFFHCCITHIHCMIYFVYFWKIGGYLKKT